MSRAKKRLRADARAWILACGDGQRWDPPASVPRRMLTVVERTGGDFKATITGGICRTRVRALCSLSARGLHTFGQLRTNRDRAVEAGARAVGRAFAQRRPSWPLGTQVTHSTMPGVRFAAHPDARSYAEQILSPPLRPWATWCLPVYAGARVMVECLACGQRGRRDIQAAFAPGSSFDAAHYLAEYHRTRCPAPAPEFKAGPSTHWDRPTPDQVREGLQRAADCLAREHLLGAPGSRTTEQSTGDGLDAGPGASLPGPCDSPGPA